MQGQLPNNVWSILILPNITRLTDKHKNLYIYLICTQSSICSFYKHITQSTKLSIIIYYMRSFVFSLVEKLNANVVGPAYRQFGKKLYAWGKQFEGENAPEDRLVPSLRKV